AVVLLVVTPVSVFGMLVSAQALVVTMFGGVGTAWGAVIGAAILVYIRYFTELAIPGWATTVGFGLLMILFQSFLLMLSITFNVLNSRSAQTYIPIKHFEDFLLRIGVVYERQ
ncbi:MAG: hypothetical protein Q7U74_14710, partial [Saprospiraceae bacterium]|nr:hypothetical protein [Saprospiraceae bacterium]